MSRLGVEKKILRRW